MRSCTTAPPAPAPSFSVERSSLALLLAAAPGGSCASPFLSPVLLLLPPPLLLLLLMERARRAARERRVAMAVGQRSVAQMLLLLLLVVCLGAHSGRAPLLAHGIRSIKGASDERSALCCVVSTRVARRGMRPLASTAPQRARPPANSIAKL